MATHSGGTLAASKISKSHGSTLVLDEVSLNVRPGTRIGIVGPNGIGKSTLLRILAGIEAPDSGSVSRTPLTTTVGYLAQEVDAAPGETLGGYLGRHGADEWRLQAVCRQVGIRAELARPLEALSGGEAARAALAAILLAPFDVLLLDEPTNDLDFAGLELLERFLTTSAAGIVVVSHDRTLLERTVRRVLELEEGSRKSREYAGGFAEYERLRGLARDRQYAAFGQFDERRQELEDALRRRRGQASTAGKGASRRLKKALSQRTRSVERRLETLERVEKPWEPWDLRLDLATPARSGDIVARLEDAVVERGRFRLGPLDVELGAGERLAVTGPNGSGKSTLLGALLGRLPLASGRRTVGSGVVVGELDQAREALGPGTLLDGFLRLAGLPPEEARTLLAKFGLGAHDVLRPAASLSPGERTRAGLALVAARGVNLLVLDEPTNHLDLPAIDELERALATYSGTLLVVTHDRRFLEAVAPTRVLEVPGTRKSL
jgi:ATPase subunit of ABC transporter with duplicated ATPase domains